MEGLPDGADTWPYGPPQPWQTPGYEDPGAAMPGNGAEQDEWHHAGVLPDDPGGWGSPRDHGQPPWLPGGGTYVPGNDDDEPEWHNQYGSARAICIAPANARKLQLLT